MRQQLARAGQGPRAERAGVVILEVEEPQPLQHLRPELLAGLACQRLGEESARHADLAMQSPHGHLDAFFLQRVVPGQHMVIDAVDQRAVEVEQEGRLLPRLDHVSPRCGERLSAGEGDAPLIMSHASSPAEDAGEDDLLTPPMPSPRAAAGAACRWGRGSGPSSRARRSSRCRLPRPAHARRSCGSSPRHP